MPNPETGGPQMGELSPLRRRMIEDMKVRNLSPATQEAYVRAVENLSRHFGRSPDRLNLEDVRAFQVHLASRGNAWSTVNQTVCALRSYWRIARPRYWLFPGREAKPAAQSSVIAPRLPSGRG